MGEAKQRRFMIEQLKTPERRADIARCVRSIDLIADGGTCAMRAIAGHKVLSLLGVKSRLVFGAMLYRAGPNEWNDVVAFCGQGNRAVALPEQGVVIGHYWLEAGPDLIDFSLGDWRAEAAVTEGSIFDSINGVPLPPINWTTEVPDFWWRPSVELTAPWRTHTGMIAATPALGEAWYHPEAPGEPLLRDMIAGDIAQWVTGAMRSRVEQMLADWRDVTQAAE